MDYLDLKAIDRPLSGTANTSKIACRELHTDLPI
jgi:hypothetical protein